MILAIVSEIIRKERKSFKTQTDLFQVGWMLKIAYGAPSNLYTGIYGERFVRHGLTHKRKR